MKCGNCKKKGITHAYRVPVINRGVEKFRDFCDECYQKVKEARQLLDPPPRFDKAYYDFVERHAND